jgi:hypothetical protein
MSARNVGGVKAKSGRKPVRVEDGCLSKREQATIRTELHRIAAKHGQVIRGFHGWLPASKRSRTKPGSWQHRFVAAYARTGSVRDSASIAGVPILTARNALCRQMLFRTECEMKRGEFVWRTIQRAARTNGSRMEIRQRSASALVRFLNQSASHTAARSPQ